MTRLEVEMRLYPVQCEVRACMCQACRKRLIDAVMALLPNHTSPAPPACTCGSPTSVHEPACAKTRVWMARNGEPQELRGLRIDLAGYPEE